MLRYITLKEVLQIHAVMMKRYGGSEAIRDLGLIEAAIARPQAGFGDHEAYPDIFMKAAVLLHSLVRNHGFIDGNKRTGITTCGTFLILNGFKIKTEQDKLVALAISSAEGQLSESQIAEWLKNHSESIA